MVTSQLMEVILYHSDPCYHFIPPAPPSTGFGCGIGSPLWLQDCKAYTTTIERQSVHQK